MSSHRYVPREPEGIQVIVGSMNMGYIFDTAENRTHNLFRPKREPIPLGHSDGYRTDRFLKKRYYIQIEPNRYTNPTASWRIHIRTQPNLEESISEPNRILKNRYPNPTESSRIDIRTQPNLRESIFEPNRIFKNRHPNPKISFIDFWARCGTVRRQLKDVARYGGNWRMWHGTEATGGCGTVLRRQLEDVARYGGNWRMWHGTEAINWRMWHGT